MSTYIIETWMGRRVFEDKKFGSFDEARGFIQEHANATATTDDEIDGICGDLYAIQIMDPFDTLDVTTADEARALAIEWQNWASEQNLSYGEMADWSNAFEKLADKFDLTDEFTENAII